jgi:putative OPT family oligopeptide transporter
VIFTVPALVLMGYWPDFKYWWVLAIAGLGGLLGVLFSVPLRRSLIVDQQMTFPEGKAAAEVLRAARIRPKASGCWVSPRSAAPSAS